MSAVGDGTFIITNVKNDKLALDVNPEYKLTAKTINEPDNWVVKVDDSGDFCTIIHETSERALDLSGRITDVGNKVQSYEQNNTVAQQWVIHTVKKGANGGRTQYGIMYHADKNRAVSTHGQPDGALLAVQIALKNFEDKKQLWYFERVE